MFAISTPTIEPTRRQFLKTGAAAGAGLIIGVHLPTRGARAAASGAASAAPFDPNAFVRIAADDTVTVLIKHIEFGQGTYTGLATLFAEELNADWSQIRAESAPANAKLYNNLHWGPVQGTGGSSSIANSYEQMRRVGATARAMLVGAAADAWGVPAKDITVKKGVIAHATSGRSARFGELAEAAASRAVPAEVPLRDPKDFSLIGHDVPRLDSPAKARGQATYTIDVTLPGMLTAVIARPPVFGAKVRSFDASAAMAVKGVSDVAQIPQGIAVLANGFWPAKTGSEVLTIDWDLTTAETRSSDSLMAEYRELAEKPGLDVRVEGDANSAIEGAAKVLEASFEYPFLAHAPMEPLDCVVKLGTDSCEVWTGSQLPTVDQGAAAAIAGLKPEQVQVHTMLTGGSFGRRATPTADMVSEAVARSQGHRRACARSGDLDAGGRHLGRILPAHVSPPHARRPRRERKPRRLAASDCRPVDPPQHAVRRRLHQERHRRDVGGGRVELALRHRQHRHRPAHHRRRRAGVVVAFGRQYAHGLLVGNVY